MTALGFGRRNERGRVGTWWLVAKGKPSTAELGTRPSERPGEGAEL